MPEEMTQTSVTMAPDAEHIDKEEAISIIASEAVSNAMENAGVSITETAVPESITETEIPAEITENVVTEVSTISRTSVETTIESTEVISEEMTAETESISVLLPETAAEAVTESTAEVYDVPETVSQIAITPKKFINIFQVTAHILKLLLNSLADTFCSTFFTLCQTEIILSCVFTIHKRRYQWLGYSYGKLAAEVKGQAS